MKRILSFWRGREPWIPLAAVVVILPGVALLLAWLLAPAHVGLAAGTPEPHAASAEPVASTPPPATQATQAPAQPVEPYPARLAGRTPPPGEPFRPHRAVPILMYHVIEAGPNSLFVPPAELDAHLLHLAQEGYQPITLQQLSAHFAHGDGLPERPIVLTFDDGYDDFYTNALPLLQKHKMVATLFVITGKVGQPGYLSWEQVRAAAAAGIEIGSHTVTHPDLRNLDPRRQRSELAESRRLLEERLGVAIPFFAYPAGRYGDQTLSFMGEYYRGAVTTHPGVATPCQDPQQLRRIRVGPRLSGEALSGLIRHWAQRTGPEGCQPPLPPRRPAPAEHGPHP